MVKSWENYKKSYWNRVSQQTSTLFLLSRRIHHNRYDYENTTANIIACNHKIEQEHREERAQYNRGSVPEGLYNIIRIFQHHRDNQSADGQKDHCQPRPE